MENVLYFCSRKLNIYIMDKKVFTSRFWFLLVVIFSGAAMRLLPHWPNFTPIAAMALFGGAYLNRKYLAFLIPLIAMLVSDVVLGFHNTMPAVYLSFGVTVGIGLLISRKPGLLNVAGASLASSILFFIVTNLAAWYGSPFYAQTFSGLMSSYAAGLVFFNHGAFGTPFLNSLLGDMFYNVIFFGAFYLARLRFPVLARC
jgi:hypothetical protein